MEAYLNKQFSYKVAIIIRMPIFIRRYVNLSVRMEIQIDD